MKKKFKLLTSIASLGLALALGVFGVLAATNQTVTITNTVDFTATKNVKATVTLAQPEVTGGTVKEGQGANFAGASVEFDGTEAADENTSWAIGDLVLEANAGNTGTIVYSYTVTIENDALATDSAKELAISVTVPAAKEYAAGSYGVAVTAEGLTVSGTTVSGTIAQGAAAASYTVTLTLDANASLASAADLGSVVSLSMN